MPSYVHEHEIEEPEPIDPDGKPWDREEAFKISSPDDSTDEVDSPDAACDLILDIVEQQFWEWYYGSGPTWSRRFKPRVKVYEVSET